MAGDVEPPEDAAALVRRAWADVLRFLRHAGLGDAAQDVAQEVFACAHVRFATCPRDAYWRCWLFRIATFKLREHRRTRSRADRKHQALRDGGTPKPRAVDEVVQFEALLDTLTDLEREVVVLKYGVGMSGPEIADALGVPIHRVRGRLLEARRRLRRLFASDQRDAAG